MNEKNEKLKKGKRDRTTLSRGCQDPGRVDAVRTGGVEGFAYACRVGIGKVNHITR